MTHPPEPKATMTNHDSPVDKRFTWLAEPCRVSNTDK
jgi:hypothetical protein